MTHLQIAGLHKRFGEHTALHGVDIDLPAGAFLVLLGPSGCGKTTTLRILAGLESPTRGTIRIGDRVVVDTAAASSPGRQARPGHGVPELRAVAAYDGAGQHRMAAAGGGLDPRRPRTSDW